MALMRSHPDWEPGTLPVHWTQNYYHMIHQSNVHSSLLHRIQKEEQASYGWIDKWVSQSTGDAIPSQEGRILWHTHCCPCMNADFLLSGTSWIQKGKYHVTLTGSTHAGEKSPRQMVSKSIADQGSPGAAGWEKGGSSLFKEYRISDYADTTVPDMSDWTAWTYLKSLNVTL